MFYFPLLNKEIKEVEESEKINFNDLLRYKVKSITYYGLAKYKSPKEAKLYWEAIKHIKVQFWQQ